MIQSLVQNPSKSLSSICALINASDTTKESAEIFVTGISQSSSDISQGDLFIALPGEKTHGAQFAKDALKLGAVAVLTDAEGAKIAKGIPVIIALNPRRAAGILSAWFYAEPMRDLFSVGITGTNGKTTVTTLLHQISTAAGRESGLIGTVETRIGKDILPSARTTPESSDLQALAALMRERHMRNLFMEVSSHAIILERIRGAHFAIVGFTNLSQDHLDFHKTMEEYFKVKSSLFTFEYADLAVINIDDQFGARLAQQCELPVITLSRTDPKANWHYAAINRQSYGGTSVSIRGSAGILIEGRTQLYGGYNLDNLLMAVAIAHESGIDPIDIAAILPHLTGAIGRLEPVRLGQNFTALVDYAHSPDAIALVLQTAREITQSKVIGVLGCGGDRDRSKRAIMGRALHDGCDIAIYTSDNPRSESADKILAQMTNGLEIIAPSMIIQDRASAIVKAVSYASSGDVVIVLGKGHEKGQEIGAVMHDFDDRIELARAIENRDNT